MLQTIRDYINNMQNISFADYYQQYILNAQHEVVKHDMKLAEERFNQLEDVSDILRGLNKMTEELKKL